VGKTEFHVRGVDLDLDVGEQVRRALSQVGQPIWYRFGSGGGDPSNPTPADGYGNCDCTGFTSWAKGHDRLMRSPDGHEFWVSTSSLVHKTIVNTHDLYRPVYAPQVGDVLAYAADTTRGRPYGHAALVTSILPTMPEWDPADRRCWAAVIATHCHSTHGQKRSAVSTEPAWNIWGKLWGKPSGTAILRKNR
jgi:hypothetical protein